MKQQSPVVLTLMWAESHVTALLPVLPSCFGDRLLTAFHHRSSSLLDR